MLMWATELSATKVMLTQHHLLSTFTKVQLYWIFYFTVCRHEAEAVGCNLMFTSYSRAVWYSEDLDWRQAAETKSRFCCCLNSQVVHRDTCWSKLITAGKYELYIQTLFHISLVNSVNQMCWLLASIPPMITVIDLCYISVIISLMMSDCLRCQLTVGWYECVDLVKPHYNVCRCVTVCYTTSWSSFLEEEESHNSR